jgi:hypothetical protein
VRATTPSLYAARSFGDEERRWRSRGDDEVRIRVVAMTTVCGALLFAGPSSADAKVLLPNCGFSEHGGRAAPRSWDHGCIGGSDLVRATWRGWANRVAFGKSLTAFRERRCRGSRPRVSGEGSRLAHPHLQDPGGDA